MYTVTFHLHVQNSGTNVRIMTLNVQAASEREAVQIFFDMMDETKYYYEFVSVEKAE